MIFAADGPASTERWVVGDRFGLSMPADAASLLDGGTRFLTAAFQACGSLDLENGVAEVVSSEEFSGGGTGRKLLLTVRYERPEPDLPEELFVKFSRDFDDEVRDRGRSMMVSEVDVALLSMAPEFPVPAPRCLFADIEAVSATGLLVTERIPYGSDGIEPLHPKCMDHRIADPFEHYRAILDGLATLSGAHRAGRLPIEVDERFPYDQELAAALVGVHAPEERLLRWARTMFDFVEQHPQLFPAQVHGPELREQLLADIPAVISAEPRIRQVLTGNPGLVAFAHWNANIDNCWFERQLDGRLRCGFIDWANAGPTNVAQSVLGAISGAPARLWHDHLDDLLRGYAATFAAQGAHHLDPDELRLHVLLIAALSGLGFSMGAPVAIAREIADVDSLTGPLDEAFAVHENARIQLHMMTNLLENWRHFALGDVVRAL